MRKIILLLLSFILFCGLTVPAGAAESSIRILLDDTELKSDTPAIVINGRTMVPLRTIFESLGAIVEYDPKTQNITARRNDTLVQTVIGQKKMSINGSTKAIDTASSVINGRTLVPARFIAEAFDCDVSYSAKDNTVRIRTSQSLPSNNSSFSLNHSYYYLRPSEKLQLTHSPSSVNSSDIKWVSTGGLSVNDGLVSVVEDGYAIGKVTATTNDGQSSYCWILHSQEDSAITTTNGKSVYEKWPEILSLENVATFAKVGHEHEYELSMPEFDIYDYAYHYTYWFCTLDMAEDYARDYAYYLRNNGYSLIREEDDPQTVQNRGNDIVYELKSPSGKYLISIKGELSSTNHPVVDVDIEYADGTPDYAVDTPNYDVIKQVVLSESQLGITPGEVMEISATCIPMYAYPELTWTSSNPSVATVQYVQTIKKENVYNGTTYDDAYIVKAKVTAVSAGSSVITVTAQNGMKATINVSVHGDNVTKAQAAVDALRSILKFPASLSLNSVRIYQGGYTDCVEIDYSAMNGFGGYNRRYYVYTGSSGSTNDYSIIDKYGYSYITIDISKLE